MGEFGLICWVCMLFVCWVLGDVSGVLISVLLFTQTYRPSTPETRLLLRPPPARYVQDPMSKGLWGTLWPDSQTLTPHSHLSRPRGAKSTHFHSSKNMCPTPQYLAQEGEMGAPGGGLKQCARGQGQDRTSGGSPPMPKATFPFVTARLWLAT